MRKIKDVLRLKFEADLSYECIGAALGVAKGTDTASSDIDLMVIADGLSHSDLFEALTKVEKTLGRKVNPALYSQEDFMKRVQTDNHFVTCVLNQPKIILLGDEHAISSGKSAKRGEDSPASRMKN